MKEEEDINVSVLPTAQQKKKDQSTPEKITENCYISDKLYQSELIADRNKTNNIFQR